MGKRSNFERIPRDYYPTPYAAVPPLIPFLRGVRTFAEPCCGDGALVRHLESFGLRCVYAGDIADGQDALALDTYGHADVIITNPPYTRPAMHALIAHFQRIAPTWLLIDYDWAATRQAAPFMFHCSDFVVLPRLKWFEGSKNTGKDNHAWYKFDARHRGSPFFRNNRGNCEVFPSLRTRACERCGTLYEPQRSSSRFCSQACKQHAYRKRLSVTSSVTSAHTPELPIEPPDSSEVYRYVLHAEVPIFTAEGWELLPALDGTHHGEYSVLMRRVEQGESAMSKTDKPKTPPPSDPVAPAPDTEFRYVRQEDVAQLEAEGWTATPAIPGSRDFAFLMQRPAPQTDCPEKMPDGLKHTPTS
jgi:hypothetical protein